MAANTVVTVRCDDLRSEAELRSVGSDKSSESGMTSSVSSVSRVRLYRPPTLVATYGREFQREEQP